MTNVPNDERELSKDVYVTYDIFRSMPNTAEDWTKYMMACDSLCEKYKEDAKLSEMAQILADAIYRCMEVARDVFHHRSSGSH